MGLGFAPPLVERVARADGGFVLRDPHPQPPYLRCLGDALVRWARDAPERTFLAERAGAEWRRLTYGEALGAVRAVGQALLDRGLGPARPLALLSGNAIDHAILQLAAMQIGVPVAPISPAYSMLSQDHAKLRGMIELLAPGAVWTADPGAFAKALAAIAHVPRLDDVATLRRTMPTKNVDRAFAGVGGDTVAKILFTSGSTGVPKGVVNTQRMLCSNQAALAAGWPFLAARPPVIVDWLPWSHTFGGNHNFDLILTHGGTLYIDGGKPAPGAFDATIENLRTTPSTIHFNVPRGFDLLVAHLEEDAGLAEAFFADLELLFYAAAALSPSTWARLAAVSAKVRGTPVPMVSAWGSTETSPLVTQVHFPIDRAGVIGLPVPGLELAFVPTGSKLEMRVKGPAVAPGYLRAGGGVEPLPLDEDGFYPMGDAGRLEDPDDPARGVVFDGRIAENFKLSSATWVHVGELRVALIAACAPRVADAVIAGHDRAEVGALVFPAPGHAIDAAFRHDLAAGLARLNASRAGTSTRIERALVLTEPASIDAGEITDKGYLNQRAILDRRAALVERLYDDGDPDVIRPA